MEDKIAKLQAATDEAREQMKVCRQALDLAEQQLHEAKAKYKVLPQEEQEKLQINDTELPELMEAYLMAQNLYETVASRYQTNQRYLDSFKAKMGG
jgi:Cdc6-like AAA superfamily ATPase